MNFRNRGGARANSTKPLRLHASSSITDPVQNVASRATVNTTGVTTSQSNRTIAQEVTAYPVEIDNATASEGLGNLSNRRHKVRVVA